MYRDAESISATDLECQKQQLYQCQVALLVLGDSLLRIALAKNILLMTNMSHLFFSVYLSHPMHVRPSVG